MEYMSVIKDECGEAICFTQGMSAEQIDRILDDHPEWYLSTVETI